MPFAEFCTLYVEHHELLLPLGAPMSLTTRRRQVSECQPLTQGVQKYRLLPELLSWIHLTSSDRVCSVGDGGDDAQAASGLRHSPPERKQGR